MADLTTLPISNLLTLMRSRQISPVDLMKATLAKAERVNEATSAFITIAHERAMAEAHRLEAAYMRADALPMLAGIPVSIKDTEPTEGIRTTYGSTLFKDNIPNFDGTATANLKRAGAIVFGKTNTPAFAHKDTTDNRLQGPARNPLRGADTAGGSSGGAAIAVALGVSAVAHGTDGSGSIRVPASLCGVFGFKPSYGRIPSWPSIDLWAARTHHGVLARSVDDLVLSMKGLACASELDPLSNQEPIDWGGYPHPEALASKRGIFLPTLGPDPTDAAVRGVCTEAVARLTSLGLVIEEGSLELPATHDWYCRLWQPPLARLLRPWLETAPEQIEDSLRATAAAGQAVTLNQHLEAREQRSKFHTQFLRMTDGADYLICPTLPCASWPIDAEPVLDGGRGLEHGRSGSRWEGLYIFNLLGWPAMSVPCGHTPDGRPIGIQVVAKRNEDLLCLGVAACLNESAS